MKTLKCVLLSYFIVSQLNAQVKVGRDTIPNLGTDTIAIAADTVTLARTSAYQKDFELADQLLTKYNADHVDINGLGLHAQVLYWKKDFDRSIDLYEKAIRLFPQPSSLYLDYARVLYGLSKLTKAQRLIKVYQQYDPSNAEANIMSAYIDLWNGKIESARKTAGLLLQKYPDNAEAKDILSKISNYTIPYIKTGTQILSDDQPLKGTAFYAEGGVYKSWLLAPTAQAVMYKFRADDSSFHSLWMQLGNTFQLGTKNKIKVKGGIFQQNGNQSEFTGSAEVSHQIAQNFLLQAAMEKRPYQYSLSSIKSAVTENVSAISLSYNRNDKWFGKAGYEVYQYKDDNKINTAYLWILAPVISKSHFSVSAGYAFRYADAINNRYVSKQSLSELIPTGPYENIPGVYSPYFTPENQKTHSILASVTITPSKKFHFSSRINIGVLAKADNPYLYLDKPGGELAITSGYSQVDYTPTVWVNEFSLAASDKLSIAATYSSDKLLYYKSQRGSIELKYVFLK